MLLFEGCSARDRTLPPKTKLNPLEKTGSTTTKEFRNKELRMVVDTEGEPPQETAEKSPPPTSKLVTTPASNET